MLAAWLLPGAWFLTTDVGRQALVDERVRVTEALGGSVSDEVYAGLERGRRCGPITSGGRLLLWPPVTLAVAAVVLVLARRRRRDTAFGEALAVVTHASVPLVLGQLVALPAHVVRESLTSPLDLALLAPRLDEASLSARLLGNVEIAGLWWLTLVAVGIAVLGGGSARGAVIRLVAAYATLAALVAAGAVLAGGA